MRFWDSSAVAPLLVDEPARQGILDILKADGGLIVWWGTPVECASAIARREREGDLAPGEANAALDRLRAIEPSWAEVSPSPRVRGYALRLLRVHALTSSDSLQLAAALVAAEQEPANLGFVCLDERLSTAAQREGFTVVP
ncbi:MAG: type II toxin-antitoxin system VapC family toxin [Alphaproteobacteria bacterium]